MERIQQWLIKEKLWASWRTARKNLNSVNLYLTGRLLWEAIFIPDKIQKSHELIIMERRSIRLHIDDEDLSNLMQAVLLSQTADPTNPELFAQKFRHVMTQEVDFKRTLSPLAIETLNNLAHLAGENRPTVPIAIWSSGDVYGRKELAIPGSKEQLKRFAREGIRRLRRDLKGKESGRFIILAHDEKFHLLNQILERFRKFGVKTVFLLEDKAKSIAKAVNQIEKDNRICVIPIWIRPKETKARNTLPPEEGDLSYFLEKYNAVDSLEEAEAKIKELIHCQQINPEQIGFIVDHDDVLTVDKKRIELQEEAVLNWIQKML